MPDRAKLEDIFCRMESDYIPEHKQAADEYMQEGLPTELIFERIKVIKQPDDVDKERES